MTRLRDRVEAGRRLASRLIRYASRPDTVVLGLPRGGVAVAYEVAKALRLPLDVIAVRKLGVPGREELAMGAVASGGARVLNADVVAAMGVPEGALQAVTRREQKLLAEREAFYREGSAAQRLRGKVAILVDDGMATGATMKAAISSARLLGAARVVVAVPVAPPDVCEDVSRFVEAVFTIATPEPFGAVSQWYEDFSATSDWDVRALLEARARSERAAAAPVG